MSSDKWNPKIPRKNDGRCPGGWLHENFSMCVTVMFKPVMVPFSYTLPSLYTGSPYTIMLEIRNYDIPRNETIQALKQLMPGPYAIAAVDQVGLIWVYCDEWIDDTVIQLSNDRSKAILHEYTIATRKMPSTIKANVLMNQLIKKVGHEVS
jgi:hypothetical protein